MTTLRGLPLYLAACLLAAMPFLYRPAAPLAIAALLGLIALTPARGRRV